jgi:hypothetical protein
MRILRAIFKPINSTQREVELIWLVDEAAVEGVSYSIDRLTWLWDVSRRVCCSRRFRFNFSSFGNLHI